MAKRPRTKSVISKTGGHVHIHGGRIIRHKTSRKIISLKIKSKTTKQTGGHRTGTRTIKYRSKSGKKYSVPKEKTHTARRTSRHATRRRSH